jgi:hypothetical protein
LLKTYSWWPIARLAGFAIINLALGIIVYVLFRKAGIIGSGSGGTPPDTKATTPRAPSRLPMDAELAD